MRYVKLAGTSVPAIGQGTWYMGEDPGARLPKWRPCNRASSWA
jgi:aryl-alcohol dehydrogenase-like predicted oxidoreductase